MARHGESERSVEGLTNGDPGVRVVLTATGREEARRLGAELADDAIDLCVTSEFERAQEAWRRKFGEVPSDAAERARQARFLAARGFAGDVIRRVLAGR